MELQARIVRTTAVEQRYVKCVFCHDLIQLAEAMRSKGVCRLCKMEIAELAWRTVYDRDLNVGEIPANLRDAYKL